MMEEPTRRCVLGGLGAGLAQLLFQTQLKAASSLAVQTGKPGKLNLRLTGMTQRVLRISIAPAAAKPLSGELGVVESPRETALGEGSATDAVIWGEYRIRVEEEPLRITLTDATQRIRQQI